MIMQDFTTCDHYQLNSYDKLRAERIKMRNTRWLKNIGWSLALFVCFLATGIVLPH